MKFDVVKPSRWLVLYTYPNSEKKVHKELVKREITAYLPTTKVVRRWSDRNKKIEVPLFPNYVFVNISPEETWKILMMDKVVRFISFGGEPAIVKDTEIDIVKKLTSETNVLLDQDVYVKGDKVKVKDGPLSGLVGRVVNNKGTTRLYIELETIQQVLSIDIESTLLDKIN